MRFREIFRLGCLNVHELCRWPVWRRGRDLVQRVRPRQVRLGHHRYVELLLVRYMNFRRIGGVELFKLCRWPLQRRGCKLVRRLRCGKGFFGIRLFELRKLRPGLICGDYGLDGLCNLCSGAVSRLPRVGLVQRMRPWQIRCGHR